MPDTPDDRLSLVERAQLLHDSTLRLHTDLVQQHAEALRDHRARMAALEANHQTLLDLLAAQEQTQTQQRQLLGQHAERMAWLGGLMQAIKELLERGHNGH